MPTYSYQAMDASGQELKESVEAANADEAVAKVRSKGLFLLKIRETSKGAKSKKSKGGKDQAQLSVTQTKKTSGGFGSVSVKVVTQFTRQLSTLQDAGLPILRSLRILEQQQKAGLLKTIIKTVAEDVESGSSLSEAMARHPKAFDRLYYNMVAAGEAGGVLDVILQRLAEFMEKAQALKRQVKGAMIYPSVVLTFAVGIVSGIMIVVVPKFKEIFSDFGSELPGPTLLLMAISDWFIVSGGWVVVLITPPSVIIMLGMMRRSDDLMSGAMQILKYLVMVMAVGAGFVVCAGLLIFLEVMTETSFQQAGAGILTTWGSAQMYALCVVGPVCALAALIGLGKGGIGFGIDRMLLTIPVIGAILGKTSIARFTRTLGTLITAGVPILEALNITRETSGNRVYGHALGQVHDSIRQGESFAGPLRQAKVCDNLVVNMIDVGEETGDLDKMLMKVADNYDDEVEALVGSLVSLLEPIMVIFLGTVVGFIVIALFLPLVTLINSVSGGG